MSRSYRHTPIMGIAGTKSQKEFKKKEHRKERKTVNNKLVSGYWDLPDPREYGNEWASPRDGKIHFFDNKYRDCSCLEKYNQTYNKPYHIFCKHSYKELMRK